MEQSEARGRIVDDVREVRERHQLCRVLKIIVASGFTLGKMTNYQRIVSREKAQRDFLKLKRRHLTIVLKLNQKGGIWKQGHSGHFQ